MRAAGRCPPLSLKVGLVMLMAVSGCGEETSSAAATSMDSWSPRDAAAEEEGCNILSTYESIQEKYFQPSCVFFPCHGAGAVLTGLSLERDLGYVALVGVESRLAPGMLLVAPGDPDRSFLISKIEGTHTASQGKIMPPSATAPLDPECRIRVVREWIQTGAVRR